LKMRAVQFDGYGPPSVLQLRNTLQPQPAADQVLIDVHAASLNPIDWKLRAGRLAANVPLAFPATPGRDGAGVVGAVGSSADPALVGKRVLFFAARGQGTWAEQIALPIGNLAVLPDDISHVEGAALPLAGTSAWISLVDTANLSKGMRVLVHAGAGGVGVFAIQIARSRGAEVFATCSQRNADFVASLGAQVIAYDQGAFETKIGDVDVVLDSIGGDVHRRSYQVLRRGGLMVCLNAEPYIDRSSEFDVTVKGAPIFPKREILEGLLQMVRAGELRVVVDKLMPITDFAHAHELSETGHVRGKVVMLLRNVDGTLVA
jgi:NADPH:quinone reductase-like Zn-dependent oxidoreductase